MKEIILIKNGEIALKGLNRSLFEDALLKQLRVRLKPLGGVQIRKAQSTMVIEPTDESFDFEEAVNRVSKVFGVSAFSRACVAEKTVEDIKAKAVEFLADQLRNAKTFKVECKRSDKSFPLKSPELSRELGGYLLSKFPHLKVDVHNPEVLVMAEVRDYHAYVHGNQLPGAGGMPVGTAGKAAVLISGGIDSPVASYMMARRGIGLTAIHFVSPPYTGPRAEQKVRDLLTIVSRYAGRIPFFIVPFTETQLAISEHCPEELFTVIMRRFMMRCAQVIAKREKCKALITGESVGQVASQTLDAIVCTDKVCEMPVFRPLIGTDKEEIIRVSRKIDTFETSILPYEDCCTVFTPKHPKTKPNLDLIEKAEAALDIDGLVTRAVENTLFEMIQ
ncbi:MAG: tRNA 4-thiouridine(8) synthase ThiI [Clostridia bacterium]|nr:tRNA 4-thiouridine(8) synthase ThiI [Clostridia bacterium]